MHKSSLLLQMVDDRFVHGQLADPGPIPLIWHTKDVEHTEKDAQLSLVRREQRLLHEQLIEDETCRPDVDFTRVQLHLVEAFRCPVKRRCYIFCELFSLFSQVVLVRVSGQSKVYNLEHSFSVKQDIGGLQIPMQHFVLFEVGQAGEELLHDALDVPLLEANLALQDRG